MNKQKEKTKNIPKKIYLQIEDSGGDTLSDFEDMSWSEITWCVDRIHKSDIPYCRRKSRRLLKGGCYDKERRGEMNRQNKKTICQDNSYAAIVKDILAIWWDEDLEEGEGCQKNIEKKVKIVKDQDIKEFIGKGGI